MLRNILVAVCSFAAGICLTAFMLSIDDDRAALMRHHEAQKNAHLTYDAELLADLQTDPVIYVSNGDVADRTREQTLEQFRRYFGSVEFEKWEDMQEPIVRISEDGSLAAMIVRKHVVLHEKGDTNGKDEAVFAWISLFEKANGEWKIFAIASTRATE